MASTEAPRRRRLLLTVVAVLALAAGIGTLALQADTQPTAGAAGGDPHYRQTVDLVQRLLAQAPVLPHAQRRTTAPAASLAHAYSSHGTTDHEVRRTAWWVAPGSVVVAARFYRSHVIPGMTPESHGTDTSGDWADVSFDAHSTDATDVPSLDATMVAVPAGVAVRVDAFAIWLPSRRGTSRIADPTSVVVTAHGEWFDRPARTVARTFGATDARRLAKVVDGLGTAVRTVHSCPPAPVLTDTLVFRTPRGTYRVDNPNSSCGDVVELTAPGGSRTGLAYGHLHEAVLAALGLPEDYFAR